MKLTAPWHRCTPGVRCAPPSAAERAARASLLAETCGCAHSHTLVLDSTGRILRSSGAAHEEEFLGYTRGALDGIHISHLVEDAELACLESLLGGGEACVLHVRDVRGQSVACRAELRAGERGSVCTELGAPEVLHVLHLHDASACSVSGRTQARRELLELTRASAEVGVVLLDLDGFRLVNESLGWTVGDELLRRLEQRLAEGGASGGWQCSGRIGDDEFYLLRAGGREELQESIAYAQQLLAAPVALAEIEELSLTAGAGWSWSAAAPGAPLLPDALLRSADVALGAAKRAGQGEVRGGGADEAQGGAQLRLAHELRVACERPGAEGGSLEVHYQPTVDLASSRVHGVEALVRWAHPERGLLAPGAFLELAEESELITRIGQIVLDIACADAAWLRSQPGCEHLCVNVNVVARQLQQLGFVEQVERSLSRAGLVPEALVLEITEQATIGDGVASRLSLQLLRELGVAIAIDDFGTGYSALAYLPELPAQILKIDRQFVQQIEAHDGQARLVRAITHLAHEFEMIVVAEGVEEPEQHRMLREMGCEVGQGYLYSRPVPRSELLQAAARAGEIAARHSVGAVEGPTLPG